jgi:hypothetical protein
MIRALAKNKTLMRAHQYAVVDHNHLADCMDCKIVHQFFNNEFCDPCSVSESTASESTPWYFVNEDLDDNALKQCGELHFPVIEHGANAQAIAKIGHDFIQYEFLNM